MWELIYKVKRRFRTRIVLEKTTKQEHELIKKLMYLIELRRIYKSLKKTKENQKMINEIEKVIIAITLIYFVIIGDEENVI